MRSMSRRRFLVLEAVTGSTICLGGLSRFGRSWASGAQAAIPTVDRLVLTNVVDYVHEQFALAGQVGDLRVQRARTASARARALS